MPHNTSIPEFAFIGFGEAAQAFIAGWSAEIHASISAYDIKTGQMNFQAQKLAEYIAAGIAGYDSVPECIASAEVIFSMVTADQALAAGQSVANSIPADCLFFDCNSCAPDTKRAISRIINAAGGRYVDVALMSPVFPLLHQTPVLISGHAADDAMKMMERLGMSAKHARGEVGTASSIKMVRSIMIKGLEALTAECVLAGRKAGVEDIVLETLEQTFPDFGWTERATYMLERMMVHGTRRAAEMREVALTVGQLGLVSGMSRATTNWQQTIGDLQLDPKENNLAARADAILAALADKPNLKE